MLSPTPLPHTQVSEALSDSATETMNPSSRHHREDGRPRDSASFTARLRALEESRLDSTGCSRALILASADRFEAIYCSLGAPLGQQLAAQFNQRLLQEIGSTALAISPREGEMAILLDRATSHEASLHTIERICSSLQAPFCLDEYEIYLTISTGTAFTRSAQAAASSLLEEARLALFQARSEGYNRHTFFSSSLRSQLRERLRWENDLRRGLQRNEFVLHYQPIFSLDNREMVGLEALVRWEHPQHGLVFPGDFVPIAEEAGLIESLDWWVLQESCQQMQCWLQQFPQWQSLHVSVNLSNRQFSRPDLPKRIDEILAHSGLDARHLGLEIVETVLMENADAAANVLHHLNERGIRLSIDDFGTGYSSLSYLQHFPASFLKVDRSFVARVACDRKTAGILRAVMMLAQQLDMEVIAEGIEFEEQFWCLKGMECSYGQGYWFSHPLDARQVEVLLAAR